MKKIQKLCVVGRCPEVGFQYSVDARLQYDAIVNSNCPHLQSDKLAQKKKKKMVPFYLLEILHRIKVSICNNKRCSLNGAM